MRRRGPGARGVACGALAWAVPAVVSLAATPAARAAEAPSPRTRRVSAAPGELRSGATDPPAPDCRHWRRHCLRLNPRATPPAPKAAGSSR